MHSIIYGDCLEEMRKMESNSISCIVTDPPYGLGFMGKHWDAGLPHEEIWKEALRVVKPGGFLLAFGGSRTYHRLTCSIEDAGWEIRDCIQWIYGSGFPKSHNHFGIKGYGTSLKPAYEPIVMAMKSCDGTFANNAEKWGQAGINIDECRVFSSENLTRNCLGHASSSNEGYKRPYHTLAEKKLYGSTNGRWPANVIFDEETAEQLDQMTNITKSAKGKCVARKNNPLMQEAKGLHTPGRKTEWIGYGNSGGASRFFYCAKASSSERSKNNNHPTVKPLKLMEYLIKLVMPPNNGILLDPFAGSGTTIVAAKRLGFNAIGIEKESAYCEIAKKRIEHAEFQPQQLEFKVINGKQKSI